MGRTSEKILVIDTETVGNIPRQIAYDVGGLVTDRSGKVYHEFHFVVKEIFADLELMATAYYANKFQTYIGSIYEQDIEPIPFAEVLRKLTAIVDLWDVKKIAAYNLQFDLRAMENTCNLFFENKNWLNRELEPLCIMCAACDILYGKKYIKLARERGWVTDKGNIKTSAECGFRYVSGDFDFEEAHRGLDDCRIEKEILRAVYAMHKPFDGSIRAFPMRQVWKREAE